jgi:Phosphoesterase family
LKTWVPKIIASPAFRQDGLLIVAFDEAAQSDTSSCCGEIPGVGSPSPGVAGPGGGLTGAVLVSPCIAPGTVTQASYNHYSMLASVEDIFGLSHLGYAALPGETPFGADIYNRPCGAAAPQAQILAPPLQSSVSTRARVSLRWSATTAGGTSLAYYTVRARQLGVTKSRWRTLLRRTTRTSYRFRGALGHTYSFSVTATNLAGQISPAKSATTVIPSGVHPRHGLYSPGWRVGRVRGAWQGHAISSHTPGAAFTLRYVGGGLEIIGERTRSGGVRPGSPSTAGRVPSGCMPCAAAHGGSSSASGHAPGHTACGSPWSAAPSPSRATPSPPAGAEAQSSRSAAAAWVS